ncbi:glycoside hydrolase family 114 protein [Periconia macrospinosa]|uniref:alpha-galactosidase n=1 Tax=Periconia macrospinosa TaxID=97972 RepID=A0A2V1EBJ5_9PLEO|nr:glycoside hydrolase family 114 protein [Periconia macrospinosa]
MRYAPTFALIGTAAATAIAPRAVKTFPAGSVFDIVLEAPIIDIDLEDNEDIIATLAKTKTVICYFSAGSREDWRSDANKFGNTDFGKEMGDWEGENWVDVKSENIRTIMKNRITRAAKAGCHAVDPDNVDGYNGNQDGYGYDESAYVDYITFLADTAKANNLAIGLKNAIEIISNVKDKVQFAVNEQCHEHKECAKYQPFTKDGKAVFNIEYGTKDCSDPTDTNLSTVLKNADQKLNTLGGQC